MRPYDTLPTEALLRRAAKFSDKDMPMPTDLEAALVSRGIQPSHLKPNN